MTEQLTELPNTYIIYMTHGYMLRPGTTDEVHVRAYESISAFTTPVAAAEFAETWAKAISLKDRGRYARYATFVVERMKK